MYVNVLVERDALLNAHRRFQVEPACRDGVKHTHHAYPLLTRKIRIKTFCSTFKKGSCWRQKLFYVSCLMQPPPRCSVQQFQPESLFSCLYPLPLFRQHTPNTAIRSVQLSKNDRRTLRTDTHTRTHCTHTCSCHCSS